MSTTPDPAPLFRGCRQGLIIIKMMCSYVLVCQEITTSTLVSPGNVSTLEQSDVDNAEY